MKAFHWILVGLLALFGLAGGSVLAWAWSEDRPVENSATAQFRIAPGETLTQTAQRMADLGLIRNPLLFRLVFQWEQGEKGVPSGTFSIPGGMSVRQAAAYLRSAKPLQVRVTIPEGWTATKIARLLEEKSVVKAVDFLALVRNPAPLGSLAQGLTSLDGRLFPETYLFALETPAVDVARVFLQTFRERTAAWGAQFSPEEWNRRLVLASIVEREYRLPNEASLIASVFLNRLDHGIALGSCATIEYILTEIQGRPHPKRIFFVHTEIPSPYNTYLNKGLPPGPICNPGLTALRASLEPVDSDYLYFVISDPSSGKHQFSTSYAGHQKAREAYLNSFVTKG